MDEPRKYILDRFQELLYNSFENYCDRHNLEKSQCQFITFLIDRDLISQANLKRFTILEEFQKITTEQKYPKTLVVDTLAHRFHISERAVWGILRYSKSDKK